MGTVRGCGLRFRLGKRLLNEEMEVVAYCKQLS